MHEYQLAVLKISDTVEEGDMQEQAQANFTTLKEMLGFIRAVLNLDDEAYDKLLDLDNERTSGLYVRFDRRTTWKCRWWNWPKRVKSKGEQIFDLENRIEDLKIIAKKSIQGFGWTLDQYYDTDYYELMKILNAKEEEDRMVDPTSLL